MVAFSIVGLPSLRWSGCLSVRRQTGGEALDSSLRYGNLSIAASTTCAERAGIIAAITTTTAATARCSTAAAITSRPGGFSAASSATLAG